MNTAVRRPGPKLWLALLTIVLGVAVGVTSVVMLVVNVSDEILGSTYPIPSTISLHHDQPRRGPAEVQAVGAGLSSIKLER